jgi:hypothetical protein
MSPYLAVMLPPSPPTVIHKLAFIDLNGSIIEKNSPRPAQIFTQKGNKIVFHEKQTGQLHEFSEIEMDQLYQLAVKYRNNSLSKEDLIAELRG